MAELMPSYIEVLAEVRYWDDATVNGVVDDEGELIPLRKGDVWKPIIRLADGVVMDWPQGTVADVHYKVCDAGHYWLLDEQRQRIAKWGGYYVPNDILCPGENGHGDYIILQIAGSGAITGWRAPRIEPDEWKSPEPRAKQEAQG